MTTEKAFTPFGIDLCLFLGHRDRAHLVKYIKKDSVPKACYDVIQFISTYFELTTDTIVNWNKLGEWAVVKHVDLDVVLLETLHDWASKGHAATINESALQVFIDMHYADLVADHATAVATGAAKDLIKVQDVMDRYRLDSVSLTRESTSAPSTAMDDLFDDEAGLDWPLDCLNKMLGPISNEFVIVASRPDGGKTTMLANMAVHAARRLNDSGDDRVVLWFNNEEAIRRVKRRLMSCATGLTSEQIEDDPLYSKKEYEKITGNHIVFVDDVFTPGKVERVIDTYKPGFIVIDQLYNMELGRVSKGDTDAEKFKKLCEWARNVAKHNCPVVASSQLDGTAEGQKYPNMSMLYGSKTGAQGAADVILMIGRDEVDPDIRYLSTPKNKLTGKSYSAQLTIKREIARYE